MYLFKVINNERKWQVNPKIRKYQAGGPIGAAPRTYEPIAVKKCSNLIHSSDYFFIFFVAVIILHCFSPIQKNVLVCLKALRMVLC